MPALSLYCFVLIQEEWDLCSDACQTIWKMQAAENADIAS